jgi:uncharacterized repeat protein (TIGR03803 family)
MTNDSINPCDHPGWFNQLIPSIQRERPGPFAWISKAAHAFLNHPLGLSIPPFPWHRRFAITSLAAPVMALALLPSAVAAAKEHTLYIFPPSGESGYYPTGNLYRDTFGSLYGTTFQGGAHDQGTVFRLSPVDQKHSKWKFKVLYDFQGGINDGGAPYGGVVMDANGTLYGTTSSGGVGGEGVVFKLTPRPGDPSTWTEKVLYSFNPNFAENIQDGAGPCSGLIMDASGALYGTTIGGGAFNRDGTGNGTVFKLTPPLDPEKNEWTESLLWCFAGGEDGQSPSSGLTIDSTGALYGTTHYGGGGTCQDGWGNVVGCGTVFKITPPGTGQATWTETILHRFSGSPDGGLPGGTLRLDSSGALYGTTYRGGTADGGTVFKLSPPAAGQIAWTASILHSFTGPEGAGPQGGVIADASGRLYGAASGGGAGYGVVFRLSPPVPGRIAWSEAVLHNFNILTSGDNPAYGLLADAQGHLFGTAYYGGTGLGGTVFEVTP